MPTPASDSFVRIGRTLLGIDYYETNGDILAVLGIEGLDSEALAAYLDSGVHPGA